MPSPIPRAVCALSTKTVALVACACCAALLTGCVVVSQGSAEAFGQKAKQAMSKPKPKKKSSGPARVGESRKVGDWNVTVSSATRAGSLSGVSKPGSGKELLLVDVVFRNDGTEPLVVVPETFSLKSASGKTIKTAGAPPAYNAQSVRPMGLGFRGGTVLVYKIPKGSDAYVLTVKLRPSKGKTKKLRWSVP